VTTKKRLPTFLVKKCTPRQNPGYAYASSATGTGRVAEMVDPHTHTTCTACSCTV